MWIPVLALSLTTLVPPVVHAGECVVVAALEGPETVVGGDDCSHRTVPASTFKVPHALIALRTKVVTPQTVMNGEQVSWLVGALETGGRQVVFASRARASAGTLGTTAGADLALRVLNALGPAAAGR